jgi:hypothetical protein
MVLALNSSMAAAGVEGARARIAERAKRSDAAFQSWRAGAEPRFRELKRREQSVALTEVEQRAKEDEKERRRREQMREHGHRALLEQVSRPAQAHARLAGPHQLSSLSPVEHCARSLTTLPSCLPSDSYCPRAAAEGRGEAECSATGARAETSQGAGAARRRAQGVGRVAAGWARAASAAQGGRAAADTEDVEINGRRRAQSARALAILAGVAGSRSKSELLEPRLCAEETDPKKKMNSTPTNWRKLTADIFNMVML